MGLELRQSIGHADSAGLSSHVLHLEKPTTGEDLAAAAQAPASAQLFRLERAMIGSTWPYHDLVRDRLRPKVGMRKSRDKTESCRS